MWVSCQAPFRIRGEVARLLELPESRVRVIAPDVGGGFGVKTGPYREDVLLAWLARELGRPVKWVATRREDQVTTNQARGSVCEGELALDARGRITGLRARVTAPLGAHLMNAAAGSPWNHVRCMPGAYVIPACDITVDGALTTTAPVVGLSRRGPPGGVLLHRAAHRHRRARARARPRGAATPQSDPGRPLPVQDHHRPGLRLRRLPPGAGSRARGGRLRWAPPPPGRAAGQGGDRRRRGGRPTWSRARSAGRAGPSAWSARARSPRSPGRARTARATRRRSPRSWPITSASRPEEVTVMHGDTRSGPEGFGTFGSRSVALGGGALVRTSVEVRDKGRRIAARLLEAAPEDIVPVRGGFQVAGVPQKRVAWKEVATAAYAGGAALPPGDTPGLEATTYFQPGGEVWSSGAVVCALSIDRETGRAPARAAGLGGRCGHDHQSAARGGPAPRLARPGPGPGPDGGDRVRRGGPAA